MADHTFKYPDTTSPTTTLTFTRAFFREDVGGTKANQSTNTSWGGTFCSESWGDGPTKQKFTVQVPYSSETETDWTDVENFILNVVYFSTESFYWTKPDGTVRLCKILNDDTTPTEEYANYAGYSFDLLILGVVT